MLYTNCCKTIQEISRKKFEYENLFITSDVIYFRFSFYLGVTGEKKTQKCTLNLYKNKINAKINKNINFR